MQPRFVPYRPEVPTAPECARRASAFYDRMNGRRSVRMFSRTPVGREVIEWLLRTAGTAPSGAHKQPWTFVAVSDPETKRRLREAAEREERRFYDEIAPEEWLRDLAPLGTDWKKTHLTDAPWVVVVFAKDWGIDPDGTRRKHYYVNESVGIAVGFLLAAVREAGLVALTHTPSPMGFLRELFGRPANERPYVVIPVGFPAADAVVPDLSRKPLSETTVWVGGEP
ncbi:MAG: nitroreductase family protein [Methanobacteriota archaeon]